jgi:gliding motility-associated protein GldE
LSIPFDGSIAVLITTIVVLLFLLALINGAEVALFSLNYKDISMLKIKPHQSAKRIVHFLNNPKGLLGAFTIATSILTIAIIILLNFIMERFFGEMMSALPLFFVKVAVIGILLVFIGNIFPKVWAAQNPLRYSYITSFLVEIIYFLFGGISRPLIQVSNTLDNTFAPEDKNRVDAELLEYAIDKLPENEASAEEKQILKGIRKFSDTTVKQIMRPRLDVSGIDQSTAFASVLAKVEELHYSRIPIYSNTLDDIKGILYTKDLLAHSEKEDFDWQTLVREAMFVHEQKLIVDLMQDLKLKKVHIAIVVDEFGGTSGIVTMEDIVEEIVGEIRDEFDDEEMENNAVDQDNFNFEGKVMITDACKKMNLPIDTFNSIKGESDSIGGLLLEILQEIPTVGQQITSGDFIFTIKEMEKNRIKSVSVKIVR